MSTVRNLEAVGYSHRLDLEAQDVVSEDFHGIARAKGFLLVASSPLTRSSYHAGDDFAKLRDAREAKLGREAKLAHV